MGGDASDAAKEPQGADEVKSGEEEEDGDDEEDIEIAGGASWPPELLRLTQKALGAAADAARTFKAKSEDAADSEELVEAAAIAAIEVMKIEGKLPEEATVPKPVAASRKEAAAAAAKAEASAGDGGSKS